MASAFKDVFVRALLLTTKLLLYENLWCSMQFH